MMNIAEVNTYWESYYFYAELYRKTIIIGADISILILQNEVPNDIPDITREEINNCLKEQKQNASPGTALISALCKLYHACLRNSTTPYHSDRVIIILLKQKGAIPI